MMSISLSSKELLRSFKQARTERRARARERVRARVHESARAVVSNYPCNSTFCPPYSRH